MAPVKDYTGVDEALRLVIAQINAKRRVELIPSVRGYGRILADDVIAPEDIPVASTSHMDGYAVLSSDLEGASTSKPVVLKLIDTSAPGGRSNRTVRSGVTVQVATGALLPEGADAVVPVESAKAVGMEIHLSSEVGPGEHVYRAGQDIRRGELVLSKGHRIRAQDVGILVSLGFRRIGVVKKVRVAVVATGNELTPANRPRKGKIVESHSLVFLRLVEALGCVPVEAGIARDHPKKLLAAFGSALARSDLVVTLGGTSAGERDLVVDTVSSLEPDVLIHGLRLDRGRVTALASVKGKPILMLPGPIQAAANAFLIIGVPIIGELSGNIRTGLSVSRVLGAPWEARKRFSNFQKVVYVRLKPGTTVAEPISGETESMKLLTDADGYFVVPEGVTKLEAGDRVDVRLVPGFSLA